MTPRPPTPEEFNAITSLSAQLDSAKLVESRAKADLDAIKAKLAMLIPGPEEGQRTITLADKSKVIVERGLIYAADLEAMEKLNLGAEFPVPIESKTTRKLDVAGYKWYRENHPGHFSRIANFVEVKPAKVAVTIKAPKK